MPKTNIDFAKLEAMSEEEKERIHAIASEAHDLNNARRTRERELTGCFYPDLSEGEIADGIRLLGVHPKYFYEEKYEYFRSFKPDLLAEACHLPDVMEREISYAMLWHEAFGEEGLRYICSLPGLIAPKETGNA